MVTIVTRNGITFNESTGSTGWRLTYKIGDKSARLFLAVGVTRTQHVIEEVATESEGISRITALGMTRCLDSILAPKPKQNK